VFPKAYVKIMITLKHAEVMMIKTNSSFIRFSDSVTNNRYQQFDVEKIIIVYFFCVAFFSYFVSNNFKNLKNHGKKSSKKGRR
jgi:hypothetical protein